MTREKTKGGVKGIVREHVRKLKKRLGGTTDTTPEHAAGGYLDPGGRVQRKRLDKIGDTGPKKKKNG